MSDTATQGEHTVALPVPQISKGEREYHAFLRLLPELFATDQGKFVAIHEGQVVDRDTDEVTLILRVQRTIGYVPIHVGLVTAEQPVFRVPYRQPVQLRPRS